MFDYYYLIDTKTEFKLLMPINYYKLKNASNDKVKWVTEFEYHTLQIAGMIL